MVGTLHECCIAVRAVWRFASVACQLPGRSFLVCLHPATQSIVRGFESDVMGQHCGYAVLFLCDSCSFRWISGA